MELEGLSEDTVKVMEPRSRSLAGPFASREKQKLPRTSEAGGKAEKKSTWKDKEPQGGLALLVNNFFRPKESKVTS